MTIVVENLSVGDISSGKFYVEGNDGQTAHNDVMHVVMLPKREPVKIGNIQMLLMVSNCFDMS